MAGGIQLNGPGSGPWVVVMRGLHGGQECDPGMKEVEGGVIQD